MIAVSSLASVLFNYDIWCPENIAWITVTSLAALLVIYYLVIPINLIKDFSDPKQDHVQRSLSAPPVFPNGWIPVEETRNVTGNQVTRCKLYIHDLVLIRSESGVAQGYNAFCPHLGAHLGYLSEVVSEGGRSCIRCPFHGWMYAASDGACVKVPYSKDQRPPAGVKLKRWPVFETCGFVFAWFHADGLDPTWYPPVIAEIESKEWGYGGRTEDTVNCHLQEIPENGADVGHLDSLHAPSVLCGGNFIGFWRKKLSFLLLGAHHWQAEWRGPSREATTDGHIANMVLTHRLTLFGIPIYNLFLEIQQIGPSFVILNFTTPDWGGCRGAYVQAVTPMASNKQRIVHLLYQRQGLTGLILSRFMLWSQSNMLERDVQIWQRKRFLKSPALIREEKSIAQFRSWFGQFYSENSPKSFSSNLDW